MKSIISTTFACGFFIVTAFFSSAAATLMAQPAPRDAASDNVVSFYKALLQDAPPTIEQERALFDMDMNLTLRNQLISGSNGKSTDKDPVLLQLFRKNKAIFLPINSKHPENDIQISSEMYFLQSLSRTKDPPRAGNGDVLALFVRDGKAKPAQFRTIVFEFVRGKINADGIYLDGFEGKTTGDQFGALGLLPKNPSSIENLADLCATGTPEQLAAMIRGGANVNAMDMDDKTPLMYAAYDNPNPEMIVALLKAGADVKAKDSEGASPVIAAAGHNSNTGVVVALVNAGADVNAKDKENKTPLMYAAAFNPNPDMLTALLKAGADLKAKDKSGLTPLVCAAKFNPNLDVMAVLLKAGADVNATDAKGQTPLMSTAAFNPNPEMITALVNAGADLNAKDKDGKTGLDYARDEGNSKAVDALVKAGAEAKQDR
jgi:ankyrin repeat protein